MADKIRTETAGAPAVKNAGADPMWKKEHRTKKKAGDTAEIPGYMPIITNRKYQHAMSFIPNKYACLTLIPDCGGLDYKNGQLHLNGLPETFGGIRDLCTNDGIEKIPVLLLMELFAVALEKFSPSRPESLADCGRAAIYFPDLAMRLKTNFGKGNKEAYLKNMRLLRNIYGIINKGEKSGDILPALDAFEMDEERNTFHFSSPYIARIIREIHTDSIRRDENGNVRLKKNGGPQMRPAYSYLADISMCHEKNRNAAEIAAAVVALIEQAGKNVPNIRASTLVHRCPALESSLYGKPSSRASLYLKRAFQKAWALLREKTSLEEAYKGIELPDPEKPEFIPTSSTLGSMVFHFPHNGKASRSRPDPDFR